MPTIAQTIIDDLLEQERNATAPGLPPSDFFELFTAEQIHKNYGLSYDEIQSGIVGNRGGDGGIDSIYTFVNGVLATEDTEFDVIRQNVVIALSVTQSKTEAGFAEDAILRLESTARDLLDISHRTEDFATVYDAQLLRSVNIFREAYRALLRTSPQLRIAFYYATKGDHVHPNVARKAENLKGTVRTLFTESTVDFHFYGAEKLVSLYNKSKVETLPLVLSKVVPTQPVGAICLVSLKHF